MRGGGDPLVQGFAMGVQGAGRLPAGGGEPVGQRVRVGRERHDGFAGRVREALVQLLGMRGQSGDGVLR